MSNKTKYEIEQMIHTLHNNGESQRKIAEALDIPRRTVRNVLNREPKPSEYDTIIGDGCSYTAGDSGATLSQSEDVPSLIELEELEMDVSDHPTGQLPHLDSGYKDIYYNERQKRWEVWLGNSRRWRAVTLAKACEFRLRKGNLSDKDRELLQAIVDSPIEVQEALNIPI